MPEKGFNISKDPKSNLNQALEPTLTKTLKQKLDFKIETFCVSFTFTVLCQSPEYTDIN